MSEGLRITIKEEINRNQLQEERMLTASNFQDKEKRVTNAISMYSGIGRSKIYPKPATGVSNKSGSRKSESSYQRADKSHYGLFRLKKKQTKGDNSSFSAATGSMNLLKEFKRQTLRDKVRNNLGNNELNLSSYLSRVQQTQAEFITYCYEERYISAIQVIVRLLNYTIDFNLPEQFLRTLKLLADLYFFINKISEAVFYYNQLREASLLLNHNVLLVESLIGLAECCCKSGIENDGIRILKKALEYAWFYGLYDLELRLFDEIGKLHYHLGDLQKAKQYHLRHINALHEPATSALRILSHQRLTKSEEINIEMKYNQMSILLLVHLKVPAKTIQEIPLPFQKPEYFELVRNQLNISSKYFFSEDVSQQIQNILNGWFFKQEMEDPSLPQNDQHKPKKYNYLDFQLNQYLRRLQGNNKRDKFKPPNKSVFPIKESVEEQVTRKIKQPALEKDWYQKIVRQINRDHKNKLLNIRNAVRIRGFNKKIIPPLQIIRDLFSSLFQRSRAFATKLNLTK